MPSYCMYGNYGAKEPTHGDLLDHQKDHGDLWAHAEDSGCESCYVEVARWHEKDQTWRRYCFLKTLDVIRASVPSLGLAEDDSDEEVAEKLAKSLNEPAWHDDRAPIVHGMPNWYEVSKAAKS